MRTIMWLALTFSIGCDNPEGNHRTLAPSLESLEPVARHEVVRALDRLDSQLTRTASARARTALRNQTAEQLYKKLAGQPIEVQAALRAQLFAGSDATEDVEAVQKEQAVQP